VVVSKPGVTDPNTPVYLVKDPDAGTSAGGPAPGTGPTVQGIAKDTKDTAMIYSYKL